MNHKFEFKDWIWEKFDEWRRGTLNGVTDFAIYLDVTQQSLSDWMAGKYKPRGNNIAKIAQKFPDVYTALGIAPPPEADLYNQVPQPYRDQLRGALDEIKETLVQRNVHPESPEGQRLAREIFNKHGFTVHSIEIKPDPPETETP